MENKYLSVQIPKDVYDALRKEADAEDRSLRAQLVVILREVLMEA